MTDEYIARERALSLAHKDADASLSAEAIIELAEKYLAFLMPPAVPVVQSHRPQHLDWRVPA